MCRDRCALQMLMLLTCVVVVGVVVEGVVAGLLIPVINHWISVTVTNQATRVLYLYTLKANILPPCIPSTVFFYSTLFWIYNNTLLVCGNFIMFKF